MISLEEENLKMLDALEDEKNLKTKQDFYELPVKKEEEALQPEIKQEKIKLPLWSIEPPLEIRRNEK